MPHPVRYKICSRIESAHSPRHNFNSEVCKSATGYFESVAAVHLITIAVIRTSEKSPKAAVQVLGLVQYFTASNDPKGSVTLSTILYGTADSIL